MPNERRYIYQDGEYFFEDISLENGKRRFLGRERHNRQEPVHREPVKPVPTAAEIENFYTTRKAQSEHRSNIRLTSLNEVRDAILVYAGFAGDAFKHNSRAIEEAHGGTAGVLFSMFMGAPTNKFVENLLNTLERDIKTHGRYRGDWDYDGSGPFHKCNIDVDKKEDGFYYLHINAAYVGNKPELDLAKKINKPVGFYRSELQHYFAIEDGTDRFAIPMSKINAVYDIFGVDSSTFFANFNKPKKDRDYVESDFSAVTIYDSKDITVRIGLISYRALSSYLKKEQPERDYSYEIKDGMLIGPARFCRHFERYEAIGLEVEIFANEEKIKPSKHRSKRILKKLQKRLKNYHYDVEVEKKILHLSNLINDAWN